MKTGQETICLDIKEVDPNFAQMSTKLTFRYKTYASTKIVAPHSTVERIVLYAYDRSLPGESFAGWSEPPSLS